MARPTSTQRVEVPERIPESSEKAETPRLSPKPATRPYTIKVAGQVPG